MIVESKHELGFRFEEEYYFVSWGWLKLYEVHKRENKYIYSFMKERK